MKKHSKLTSDANPEILKEFVLGFILLTFVIIFYEINNRIGVTIQRSVALPGCVDKRDIVYVVMNPTVTAISIEAFIKGMNVHFFNTVLKTNNSAGDG